MFCVIGGAAEPRTDTKLFTPRLHARCDCARVFIVLEYDRKGGSRAAADRVRCLAAPTKEGALEGGAVAVAKARRDRLDRECSLTQQELGVLMKDACALFRECRLHRPELAL